MYDQRLDTLASILVNYSARVKPGELVAIAADPCALAGIEAVAKAVLKAGGHPFWLPRWQGMTEIMLEHASEEQLTYVSPLQRHTVETIDVQIGFWAESNTKALSRMDPKRTALQQSARKDVFKRFMERAAKNELRWVGSAYPTAAAAQDAEMSLAQYTEFVFSAGLLHLADPIAAWKTIHEKQERVREYLQGKKEIHFRVPPHDGNDGTDLKVSVDGSTWINCSGSHNFPDGEVFAGPRGVDGHVNYTFPAVYNGREVEGIRLAFKDGRVVDASAKKGEDYLIQMLDQDQGARNLGEIAIGTNYGITDYSRNTLFDEKIGGTFHAAVGAGYPESGNTNESALHWDMVCDLRKGKSSPGGVISADGEEFHRDGRFLPVSGWQE